MDKDTAAQKSWVTQPSFQIYIVVETKLEFRFSKLSNYQYANFIESHYKGN